MKRLLRITTVLALATAFVAATAAVASAFPTQTGACSGCHGSGGVTVSAVALSNNGTSATYSVTVSGGTGAKGWAVKSGSANVANGAGATGQFTVAVGSSYTVWGVDNATGSGTTVVSPTAGTTPPTPNPTSTPEPTVTPTPTSTPEPTATPQPPVNPSAKCVGCHRPHGNGTSCVSCHTASPHEDGEGPNAESRTCAVSVRVLKKGKPVKGAWVSIFYDDNHRVKAKTDAKGYARMAKVPRGEHDLKITYKGKLVKKAEVKLSTTKRWLSYRI